MCRTGFLFIACAAVLYLNLGICAKSDETDPEMGISIDNTIVCQGKLLKLKCHNSSLTLTIYSAVYGRTEPGGQICPYKDWAEDNDFYCGESDVTTRLQRICGRRTKCRIQVERSVFGRDFCPGKDLYLRVIYGCEYKKPKKTTSNKSPGLIPPTTPLKKGTSPQSTKKTPTNGFANITTATVLLNSTERLATNQVELNSKPTSGPALAPVPVNFTRPPGHQRTVGSSEPSVTPPAVMVAQSMRGSIGAWGPLTVCFVVLQDHFTAMILVFFAGVAAALLVTVIVSVIVVRRVMARRDAQQCKVIEVPKLNSSPGPPSPLEKSASVPTTVLVPSPEPRLIHPGTLPRHPTSDFYAEYSSAGNKEPTSCRNVVPRLVLRPPSSSKEIYRKDLNTDRIRCAHAKNDASLEMHPLLTPEGLRMNPKAECADCILPVSQPHSHGSS